MSGWKRIQTKFGRPLSGLYYFAQASFLLRNANRFAFSAGYRAPVRISQSLRR
jgi:hypothetical protein